ncbi:hypothetical protein PHYPO_G00032220 [Pangasianodon hypophthalmus]|uniref:Uncharacterized protein n=2 Tax=Pangasianodon TaxID=30992 RepID=A0A5N5MK95_PANHP|nr:hypothetical protein PHYPO_G00032220 [Pangasianodon hypophthalmus]MCI4384038.1 hypothetical protein [Pangasianodon gigas]
MWRRRRVRHVFSRLCVRCLAKAVERRRDEPAAIFRALLPLTMIQNYPEIGDLQRINPVQKGACETSAESLPKFPRARHVAL